jgi:hypothetical protein
MKIRRKTPRKLKSRPRTFGLAYQQFQDTNMINAMRSHLSSDGLCCASSKALGTSLNHSQQTASRIILRLIQQKDVHLVEAATDSTGRPITDALGRQITNRIFPWRRNPSNSRPYSSVGTGQLRINKCNSSTAPVENASPYPSVGTIIEEYSTEEHRTVEQKS